MNIVRKLKLIVVEEDKEKKNKVYKYIRDEQYNQYRGLNLGISLLYTHNQLKNVGSGAEKVLQSRIETLESKIEKSKSDLKKAKKEEKVTSLNKIIKDNIENVNILKKQYDDLKDSRILEDKQFEEKYIKPLYNVIKSQVDFQHKDNVGNAVRVVQSDFGIALKNGLANGDRSLNNYKRDFPLITRGRNLKIIKKDEEFYINWINGIKFKVLIGRKDKDRDELLYILNNAYDYQSISNKIQQVDDDGNLIFKDNGKPRKIDNPLKDYKICESSFQFNDNKLILNLNLDIKNKVSNTFVPGRVVGVDLGIKIPAYVCLNDKHYIRKSLGSFESFMKVNVQMKTRRERLYKQISKGKSGKGRQNKLQAINNLSQKRSNYNTTYNHYLSKEIIKFALDNQAGQINMEFLTSETFKKDKFMADWSYYQLQTMVKYKASKYGIEVKFVDPFLTSQTCCVCGHYEEGQRVNQAIFECKNCKKQINADYNAAQNIAKSVKYVEKKEDTLYYKLKKSKKLPKEYMSNIDEDEDEDMENVEDYI